MPSRVKPRDVDAALRALRPPLIDEPREDRLASIMRSEPEAGIEMRALPPRRPRRRLALAIVPLLAAVTLLVALLPIGDQGPGRPAVAFAIERAEAAITPAQRVLELTIEHTEFNAEQGGKAEPPITMREWSLAGTGQAMLIRRLISADDLAAAPTDEDTTTLLDRGGRVVDIRSWTPTGNGEKGQLELLDIPHLEQPGPSTFVGMLRAAYEKHRLRPTGTTADGALRLRGSLLGAPCERTEVLLDPKTFIPTRVQTSYQVARPSTPCSPDNPVVRSVETVTSARTLPATATNRRLLEIGDWPTARVGRKRIIEKRVPGTDGLTIQSRFTPMTRLPARPPLDER